MRGLIKRQLELNKNSISITASSSVDGHPVDYLLLYDPTKFWQSGGTVGGYFTVKFENIYAYIGSYSLLFYPKDYYPLGWVVNGSIDGKNWFLLDKREEDLCASFAYREVYTTTICGRNVTAHYSFARAAKVKYVRVQQIGENSGSKYDSQYNSIWHNSFFLSGVEFFEYKPTKYDKNISKHYRKNTYISRCG